MICPIMNSDSHDSWVDCEKENCQWWTQGNCIVHDFNRNNKELSSEIYKGFEKFCNALWDMKKRI